ncbi:MAG: aminoacyl--tRNA ligase-related protein [Minisyncoccia bacterium]
MQQSKLFTKTRKEAPKDEVSKNAQYLIRAGFINKELAGVYAYLPLGLRTLNKIVNVIREEMNALGGQELEMTALQDKAPWEKSGRWDDKAVEIWFKTELKNGTKVGLGFTHEEPITAMLKNHVRSFRDLPFSVYQFQTKFRNEARAKSGIMRGREFLMKDLYSFCLNKEQHEVFYEKAKQAYTKIFNRLGIGEKTYVTIATGGTFSKYSHEFQTVSEAGEDLIYVCEKCHVAVNKELIAEQSICPECKNKDLVEKKAIEVGNIFTLGEKFSEAIDLSYADEKGEKKLVFMGSYGIGPGRVMGTIVENLSDDKGIIWPKNIAPFLVHLIEIGADNETVRQKTEEIYNSLIEAGLEVLWDDRALRPGEKFADADLIGIPLRLVISEKLVAGGEYEMKNRQTGEVRMVAEAKLVDWVKDFNK